MTWSSGTCFRCLNHRAPKSKNWTVRHSIRFSKIKSNLKIFNVSIHLKHCCTLFERRTRWEERKTARWNRRMLSFLIFLTENRWESRKIYFEKWAYTTKNGKNHQIPIFSAKFFVSSCLYRELQSWKFAIPFLIWKISGDLNWTQKSNERKMKCVEKKQHFKNGSAFTSLCWEQAYDLNELQKNTIGR